MRGWLQDVDMMQLLATLAILGIIIVGIVKAWKPLRSVVRFFDRMIGAPDRPGILDRMSELEDRVSEIHHEVKYNGGGSIKDAQKRQEASLDRIEASQQQIRVTQDEDVRRLTEHLKQADYERKRVEDVAETVEDLHQKLNDD